MDNFIALLKALRIAKGLTLDEVAIKAGVHRTTVGLIEKEERNPTIYVAEQISNALGYSLAELLQKTRIIGQDISSKDIIDKITNRIAKEKFLRNQDYFQKITGLKIDCLINSINNCYKVLDLIDEQLLSVGAEPLSKLVELANLSSMVGNIIGAEIAKNSAGVYSRNRPHAFPDLIPMKSSVSELELKVALETNRPKGHLPKAGNYITFRYVLADFLGKYHRGKTLRGDTVWIWEVKVGYLNESDFNLSNTEGDSGKTAVISTDAFNNMKLVYCDEDLLPYKKGKVKLYPCYN